MKGMLPTRLHLGVAGRFSSPPTFPCEVLDNG